MSFAHALKWSFLSELAAKAIQPVVFIILARLLTPEDFGVISAALMVIGFSQIFWEAGMGKALIQRQTDIEDAANAAFWINICLGFVIAAVVYLIAGPVARTFFHDERVTAVLQVMTLQIVLGAVSSVHTALLQKDMGFKKLFWVRFTTIGLPGLASIPLAWNGMGYWALVTGTLVGQAAQVAMLWQLSHWRPKWTFQFVVAKEMGHFGAWVGASGLLGWFYTWADSLIVGMYLGSHELGLYRTGNQFASLIFAMLFGPIIPVLYSHLSRTAKEKKRITEAAETIIKAVTLIAIPIGIIVYTLARPISELLFGEKWLGIQLVIGVMSLSNGLAWTVGMNGEFYRATNKPKFETIVMAIAIFAYIPIYFLCVQQGLATFVWGRLAATALGVIVQLYILFRLIDISLNSVLGFLLKITAVMAMCFIPTIHSFEPHSNLLSLAVVLICTTMAIMTLYFLERRKLLVDIKNILQK